MILRIINEIEKALSHDLCFAALNLALTLPYISGEVVPMLIAPPKQYNPNLLPIGHGFGFIVCTDEVYKNMN